MGHHLSGSPEHNRTEQRQVINQPTGYGKSQEKFRAAQALSRTTPRSMHFTACIPKQRQLIKGPQHRAAAAQGVPRSKSPQPKGVTPSRTAGLAGHLFSPGCQMATCRPLMHLKKPGNAMVRLTCMRTTHQPQMPQCRWLTCLVANQPGCRVMTRWLDRSMRGCQRTRTHPFSHALSAMCVFIRHCGQNVGLCSNLQGHHIATVEDHHSHGGM